MFAVLPCFPFICGFILSPCDAVTSIVYLRILFLTNSANACFMHPLVLATWFTLPLQVYAFAVLHVMHWCVYLPKVNLSFETFL